jgi:hypothetical protein
VALARSICLWVDEAPSGDLALNPGPLSAVLGEVRSPDRKGSVMKRTTIRATIVTAAAALLLGGVTASSAAARAADCFGMTPTKVGTSGADI